VIDDREGKLSSRDAPSREEELEDFRRGRQEIRVCKCLLWLNVSFHEKESPSR